MQPRLFFVLFFLSAVWAGPSRGATPETPAFKDELSKQSEIYGSRGADVPEGYVIGRSLLTYSHTLGDDFKSALANLGRTGRWLDIGAGEGRAILDYQSSKYDVVLPPAAEGAAGKAQAIAISIEDRRTPQWHEAAANLPPNQIRYLFGKRLREYSFEELGQFDLITDLLGAFSYTRYPSMFMGQALGLLKLNGTLHTILQDVHFEDGTNRPYYPNASFLTEISNAQGNELKVCSWLKSISCVEVTCVPRSDWTPPVEVYRVRKVCGDVKVPGLVLTHFEAGTPPERKLKPGISSPEAPVSATTTR